MVSATVRAMPATSTGATRSALNRPLCPARISFAGFWSYGALGDLTPFVFFTFFGFFGFFFEGKMSNISPPRRSCPAAPETAISESGVFFSFS